MESLKLESDNSSEEEIIFARVRIQGLHEGIKEVIKQIEYIERWFKSCGYEISKEFVELKNQLGIRVYKNWPNKS